MAPPTAEIELVNNYVRFACIAAFLYDWVLTVGDEVDFVWSMNWRGSKTLFMLLRYVTLVQMALTAMYFMDLPHSTILIQSYVSTLLEVVIICLVQVLLQLRIYIVYGRSKKLLWSNAVLFVVELVLVFLLFAKTASKIKSVPVTPTQRCRTCSIYPNAMGFCFVAPLLLETYLLVLMLRKSWANRDALRALSAEEGGPGSIMDVLVRGSVFYFLVVASGMALSLSMFLAAPRFALWTDLVAGATGCIGGTRLIISMRKAVLQQDHTLTGGAMSRFVARPGPGTRSDGAVESAIEG